MLDQGQIRALLPQRFPMLLLDRVTHVEPGESITACKAVTCAEPCYSNLSPTTEGHDFAYPESLLIESFGQAAAILWFLSGMDIDRRELLPMLAAVRDVEFDSTVSPGDTVRHEVRLDQMVDGAGFASGEIWEGQRKIATVGSLLAVIRSPSALLPRQYPTRKGPDDDQTG